MKIDKTLNVINAHRSRVMSLLSQLSQELMCRGNSHDESKYGPEELPIYADAIDEFERHAFNTDGYHKAKASLASALQHHYENNRHHPEHFENGIDDMNLIDMLEMLCDWKAATLNHPENPGDLDMSIKVGVAKYNISPQMAQVLYNTARDFNLL